MVTPEAAAAAASGVPIIEESYAAAVRRNKTNPSSTADDHVAQVLLRKNASPKMYYDWTEKKRSGGDSDG